MRQITDPKAARQAWMHREWNALITGASSGIGQAIATVIASTGAAVCLVGRDSERLRSVADHARATARSVLVCETDLTSDSAIAELKEKVGKEFQALDVLVHCAGAYASGKLASTPVEKLDTLYKANVRMPYALTQAMLPLLKACSGQIVFINSSQGLQTGSSNGLFAATQHALKAFADSLRQEVNADGIRVLSVYPGRTATPRIKALYDREGRNYQPELLLQAEDVAEVVLTSLLLPRTAEVTNIEIRPLIKSY